MMFLFMMPFLLGNINLNVDGVRSNLTDNAMVRFNMTILVDGSSDMIVLIMWT